MTIAKAQTALRAGKLEEAEAHCKSALKLDPDNPELHYNLAMIRVRLRDMAGAAESFVVCANFAPDNPEVLNNLANAQRLSGQAEKATHNFDKALAAAPGHPGALCNRGWLKLSEGNTDSALEDFRQSLRNSPDFSDAQRGIGECLILQQDWHGAENALRDARDLDPESAHPLNSLGVVKVKQGAIQQAVEFFRQALLLQPAHPDALLNLGICCEQLGLPDEAEQYLSQAVAVSPGRAEAWFHLAHLNTYRCSGEHIEIMQREWMRQLPATARADLGFALGKALDKNAEYDTAFPYFAAARGALHTQQRFDMATQHARVQSILKAPSSVIQMPKQKSPTLVFVLGMPRSGTTLAEQILASHSQVLALGESGLVAKLLLKMANLTGAEFPESMTRLSNEQAQQLLQDAFSDLPELAGKTHVVDTTPMNFQYIGLLRAVFPGCKIIHCQRDPLDTCISIYQHPLSAGHAYANTLETLGDYYLLYQQMMEAWHHRPGLQLQLWNYEKLISEPEPAIAGLLQFCGLNFEPNCLNFHQTQRTIVTPSASQVRQPLTATSVGRWRHYAKYLGPLIERLPPD